MASAEVVPQVRELSNGTGKLGVTENAQVDGNSFLNPPPVVNGGGVMSPPKRRNGEKGYYRNEELGGPIHSEKFMRIIVIGAGASGLCFSYKLQRSFENFSLRLYEKNPEISGTWYENRYPG